jgi:two-component system, sensor histidine kinase and response regulator
VINSLSSAIADADGHFASSWSGHVAALDEGANDRHPEADASIIRTVRLGAACSIPFQIGHIAILLLLFPRLTAAVPILLCDLALTGLFLGWTRTRSFRRNWREALFAWTSLLVLSASAVGTITHQSDVFLVVLIILLFATGAFAPWGARWQTFFILVCMGAAFGSAWSGMQAPDTFEAYRLVELGTAAVMSLFVAVLTDRHSNEAQRVERAIAAARDSAQAASRAKSDFLSTMSHEIRTPMNAILGMAELLADSPLAVEQRKYLSIMINNGNALLDLINDILDFERVENGHLKLERTIFDPHELAERVAETLSIRAHQKKLELVVKLAADTPRALIGDPLRLRQVLINLLGNAIKFTETGEVELEVRPQDDMGTLHFTVRDTGIGIPAGQLDEIFKSYAQAEASTARKYGGSGLGLAIVAQLARLMGGRIWVESEVGQGTTFHFVAHFNRPAERSTEPAEPSLGGLDVLVVDDNLPNQQAICAKLTQRGANVTGAANGARALDLIRSATRPYDAILLDCRMPAMDGYETVRRLLSEGLDVEKVIPMLASDELNVRLPLLRKLGLLRHLIKPVRQTELCGAIIEAAAAPAGLAVSGGAYSLETESISLPPAAYEAPLNAGVSASFGRPLRVLVADDSEDNRLLIEAFLGKSGCCLDHADNGETAVRKFTESQYDVILMDIQMPVLDGYQAVRQIREWEHAQGGHRTPVIALTASVLDEAVDKSYQAGCDSHVSKPVRRNTLMTAIREVVTTRP